MPHACSRQSAFFLWRTIYPKAQKDVLLITPLFIRFSYYFFFIIVVIFVKSEEWNVLAEFC